MRLQDIIQSQRDFFYTGETKKISFRKEKLLQLSQAINDYEERIYRALYEDLNKSEYESYLTELSLVKEEIQKVLKNLDKWVSPNKKKKSLFTAFSGSYTMYEPYGVVLIISPWNYPFLLTLLPLVGAMAAGNCSMIKLSKGSKQVSAVIRDIIRETFDSHYINVIDDQVSNDSILSEKYDYIFFTGSNRVGKIVMRYASDHLTPISLELGGKSPCIVDKSANIKESVRKILWGKSINAGQTCIAPDYVLVDELIKDEFTQEMKKQLEENYRGFELMEDYPKIINLHHYIRLCNILDKEKNVLGGGRRESTLKIAPAVIPDASFQSEVMRDEIFGPILPIIGYYRLDALLEELKKKPKPLACYIFSKDQNMINQVNREFSYGGGCVNDCLLHIANSYLPFGGVGNSGMGAYHGYYSFKTFSHEKAILVSNNNLGNYFITRPFSKEKLNKLRKWIKR
ncbi:MAG: aldehyde dehydrogenase family protein [Lachnospiraceae bacterium]|nr:aldehyde dehydrogenase family protein [Lachnospiraceae bacterium]